MFSWMRPRPSLRKCVNSSSLAASGSRNSTASPLLSSAAEEGSAANQSTMSRKSTLSLRRTSMRRCSSRCALRLASSGGPATKRISASWPVRTARAESFQSGNSSNSVSPMTWGQTSLPCRCCSGCSRACRSTAARTASRTASTSMRSSPCSRRKSCMSIQRGARRCSLISWICFSTGSCELMYCSRLEHCEGSSESACVMAFVWHSKAFCRAGSSNCMCVSGWKFPQRKRK
mmetsp:Transcript_83653/g.231859  ORF Transcript_83653/g.231859 Transcript_83653/m.231859 type:complete len:232 (-) Transcript_83653:451-1146(-)